MSLSITPQTKVGELLDAYPGIEDTLIEWVPAFRKLKNPILRRTVAKVATLDQAARIGGVSTRELVLKLRVATGQSGESPDLDGDSGDASTPRGANAAPEDPGAHLAAPAWVESNRLHSVLDAETLLAGGDHPLGRTQAILAQMTREETLRIDSTFRPAPLIDLFRNQGLLVYHRETEPGRHQTWLARP
ncbi:MAG: DUF1858 domain-containing protein [Bryobacterales bacterium]|nr:DUF1858 domain-containing protein [Bryobacterales bacterium]